MPHDNDIREMKNRLMKLPAIHLRRPLSRRQCLRGGVAALALPWLEAMTPPLSGRALGSDGGGSDGGAQDQPPRRMVAICATLGFHTPFLFPRAEGRRIEPTAYLEPLHRHLDTMTLFSGLSHPDQQGNNGHASELTWLTSAPRPGLAGFRNSISIDQVIAAQIGLQTRFPSLVLSTSGRSMSWNSVGVEIPAMSSPAKLFKSMFVRGSGKEVAEQAERFRRGRSILDAVVDPARRLDRQLGHRDREKLDEYLTAVGELEGRLREHQRWLDRPKPAVEREVPEDITDKTDAIARQRLMYEMIAMALRTDSTRTVTFQLGGLNAVPKVPGVESDWHGLSHHGKDPAKINELKMIERAEFEAFGEFLDRLADVREGDASLLDQTSVLFGSNLGNASAHDWRNLPIMLAGGQFRHHGYVAHDAQRNTPLANLFVALAQQMGVEIDRFGSSTAAGVRGLEPIG